ncbi:MAG: hypothetical protein GY856_21365, partial [bacterium]|nr:hypothetical protein [bacterium]
MAKQPSRSGKNVAALSWAALILLIPAVLYITHVTRQLHEVTQQNLRILGTAADRIEVVLDNAEDTAKSLVKDLGFACEFLKRQPRLKLVESELQPGSVSTCEDLRNKKPKPAEITTVLQPKESGFHLLVSNRQKTDPEGAYNSTADLHFSLRVDLDQVLDEVPFDGAFAHLLIADDTGNVVVQKGTVLG